MLVTFECKVYSNITYFGDIAKQLLHMMGHSGTIPSAILADDVPVALNHLQTALAAQRSKQIPSKEEHDNNTHEKEIPIQLETRAKPLIELLTAASNAHCDVMWH